MGTRSVPGGEKYVAMNACRFHAHGTGESTVNLR
jgi:hypothetical protein